MFPSCFLFEEQDVYGDPLHGWPNSITLHCHLGLTHSLVPVLTCLTQLVPMCNIFLDARPPEKSADTGGSLLGPHMSRCVMVMEMFHDALADFVGCYQQLKIPIEVTEWQRHMRSFLLDTKPLWHWGKWKSGPTSKRDSRPRYRPTGKCPLYRFEATAQLLHSAVGSNQVGCSCTWQRSLPREPTLGQPRKFQHLTRAEEVEITRLRIGHTKATKSHIFPRTTGCLSPLWSNIEHWPYAPGVCSVTRMPWRILCSSLIEYPLWDNSWDLHSGIPARSRILLSDMNGQTF